MFIHVVQMNSHCKCRCGNYSYAYGMICCLTTAAVNWLDCYAASVYRYRL